jgi:hypothetical protein
MSGTFAASRAAKNRYRGVRGGRPAGHPPQGRARRIAGRSGAADVLRPDRQLAGPANLACLRPGFRERDRAGEQTVSPNLTGGTDVIGIDNLIDDAGGERLRRGQRPALRAHFEREPGAGQPGQPLSPPGSGDDAEVDFRLSDLCVSRRDAEVAGHRHFETSSERVAMDRRNERLRRVLEALQEGMDVPGSRQRVLAGLQEVEDLDVGPGNERRAGADENGGFCARVRPRPRDGLADGFPHFGAERVDRRVVDGQNGNAVLDFVANEFGHSGRRQSACVDSRLRNS